MFSFKLIHDNKPQDSISPHKNKYIKGRSQEYVLMLRNPARYCIGFKTVTVPFLLRWPVPQALPKNKRNAKKSKSLECFVEITEQTKNRSYSKPKVTQSTARNALDYFQESIYNSGKSRNKSALSYICMMVDIPIRNMYRIEHRSGCGITPPCYVATGTAVCVSWI